MSSLLEIFATRKTKSLFIPYFSLGDPSYEDSILWGKAILKAGADILELGIPFTDPTADGPVIQKSYKRALDNTPFSMKLILETTKSIHKHSVDTPIVYLTYLNPIMQYGLEKFFQESYESGVRGIVIPDIPFDAKDYDTIFTHALNAGINIINLITPATKPDRIKLLKEKSSGFIYYVTSYGVTGERKNLDNKLAERIQFVKDKVGIPVCAGFGISTPEQAMEISNYADGVIIGSAIQKIIESNSKDSEICVTELYNFVRQVRDKML